MNLDLYEPTIQHEGFSVFTGGKTVSGAFTLEELETQFGEGSLMRAFLSDDDIQEITITSTNIGFSRTYWKQFKGVR